MVRGNRTQVVGSTPVVIFQVDLHLKCSHFDTFCASVLCSLYALILHCLPLPDGPSGNSNSSICTQSSTASPSNTKQRLFMAVISTEVDGKILRRCIRVSPHDVFKY